MTLKIRSWHFLMARHHINSQNTIISFALCPKIYLILYPSLGNSTTRITHSEGQVVGGYYADPAAECQVFHVCATDSAEAGPNSKWSFLCPNGTIFNQNYFICDWWFNFDCAEAEGLYGLGFCVLNFLSILSGFLSREKLSKKWQKSKAEQFPKLRFLNAETDQTPIFPNCQLLTLLLCVSSSWISEIIERKFKTQNPTHRLNDQLGATGDDQAQYGADDQSQYNEAASNTQETYESPAAYGKPKTLS